MKKLLVQILIISVTAIPFVVAITLISFAIYIVSLLRTKNN